MIIGISGRIGSGKDTVGRIIQYLVAKDNYKDTPHTTFEDFMKGLEYNYLPATYHPDFLSRWKIKKFAGKLKEIVSLLTGINVNDLEKAEVKDSDLGEEWDRLLYANLEDSTPLVAKTSVRWLLQRVGTEAMRDVIHKNVWVNALFSDYVSHKKEGGFSRTVKNDQGIVIDYEYEVEHPNWIITDMRFPNELAAIKERKGITIRINRKTRTYDIGNGHRSTEVRYIPGFDPPEHPSETALDNAEFDYVIDNDGTIEELTEKVKEILIKEGII